jgi:hypothetical protein
MSGPSQFTVNFHFGNEHTKFETSGDTTLTAVKDRGLRDLNIVQDPAFDYLLNYRDELVANETQTLDQLVAGGDKDKGGKDKGSTHVTFHVQKRPKGG